MAKIVECEILDLRSLAGIHECVIQGHALHYENHASLFRTVKFFQDLDRLGGKRNRPGLFIFDFVRITVACRPWHVPLQPAR